MRIGDGYTGPEMASPTAWVAAAIVLSIGLTLTAAAVIWQQRLAREDATAQQERQLERLEADLVKRLSTPVYGLKGARGAMAAAGGKLDRRGFRAYVASRDLPQEFPGTRGFGFIEPVPREQLPDFIARQRRDDGAGFELQAAGSAPQLYVVSQIAPLEANRADWGRDIGADPTSRRAIERAVDSGLPTLSSPTALAQAPQLGPGLVLLVPVYEGGRDPGTPELRRAALLGLLYAPLVIGELLDGVALQAAALLDLRLSVRRGNGELVPLLAARDGAMLPAAEMSDQALVEAALAQTRDFEVAGRQFQLQAALTDAAARRLIGLSGLGLQLAGTLLSLLLAVTVWLLAAGRERARQLAHSMTADLARLAMVASHTTNAVLITDTGHRIVWVNDGFTRLTGYSADEALGRQPQELLHFELTDADTLHGLNEAMSVGLGGKAELQRCGKDGRRYWVDIEIQPLYDASGALSGFMEIESDITARKQLQAQAEEARQSLQDLYDNAPCAYYALDRSGKFLQINALGLRWLGCSAEQVIGKLGPRDFFSPESQQQFDAAFPRFLREGRVAGLEFDMTGRHGEARRVSLAATAIYDASGAYLRSRSVMFDITETHLIRQRLQQLTLDQEAMLESDLLGIAKLRKRCIVWRNQALERMFGYGDGELLDTPVARLHVDEATYEALGAAAYPLLRAGGRYRTQVQMRRKDGALIWVDLAGVQLPGSGDESLWMMVDITQSKVHQARMEHAALHDALTDLPNRLLLGDRLAQAIHAAERNSQGLALAYLDLNGFKQINDTHGHDAGDEVLKVVAARLQAGLRASDTVARLGGDEFVVLLSPAQGRTEAERVLARLLDAVARPITLASGAQVGVGSALGLAHYPDDGRTPDALMRRADEAMFADKRNGGRPPR